MYNLLMARQTMCFNLYTYSCKLFASEQNITESDSLVRDLIAKAKGGTHAEYQPDGKRTKRLENE